MLVGWEEIYLQTEKFKGHNKGKIQTTKYL